MKNCAHCGGKFGLTRHRWFYYQFCKKSCLEDFLAKLAREKDRLRKWIGFLKSG
jgi:hypothetical protein